MSINRQIEWGKRRQINDNWTARESSPSNLGLYWCDGRRLGQRQLKCQAVGLFAKHLTTKRSRRGKTKPL